MVRSARFLLGLAAAEERHAAYWERLLGQAGQPGRATLRARLLAVPARRGSVGCSCWR
jgi:vacuolar iron transporter family protein